MIEKTKLETVEDLICVNSECDFSNLDLIVLLKEIQEILEKINEYENTIDDIEDEIAECEDDNRNGSTNMQRGINELQKLMANKMDDYNVHVKLLKNEHKISLDRY